MPSPSKLVALLALIVLLVPAASFGQSARHVTCTPVDATQPAPNAGMALYWQGNTKAAQAKFKELLATQPNDPDLTEGSVRANIELGDVAAAAEQAQAALSAHPESAAANTAQGEVLFRQGKIPEADKAFAKATQLDPCYAPARMQIARVARVSSMYATAQKAITVAHALNQRDPDITYAWIHTLPRKQQVAELKRIAQGIAADSESGRRLAGEIAYDEEAISGEGQHKCELVSSVDSTKIPMAPIMWDASHVETWGLETQINGQSARLVLDSGASGLVVGHAFAAHAGLKMAEATEMGGFGDHGPQKSHIAYAETIKIGNLEFHDCRVDVSDRREVVGMSGLIGTDVLRHYLISVNYPEHTLALGPLPARPSSRAEATNLDTEEEQGGGQPSEGTSAATAQGGPQDRYIAPEMKEWTQIFRFRHMLLISTLVNDIPEGLMVLDTGDAAGFTLSYAAAKNVTHARADNLDTMRGLSGKVEHMSMGGHVTAKFGRALVPMADILVQDFGMSQAIGTEISGFIGAPILNGLVFQIDYRDGLVNFVYDKRKDPNLRHPENECSYCNSGYTK